MNNIKINELELLERQNETLKAFSSISTHAIYLEVIRIGMYGEILLAINLVGLIVIGMSYNPKYITTVEVCNMIKTIQRVQASLPQIEVKIIPSDYNGIYNTEPFNDCIKSSKFKYKYGDELGEETQNKVIEPVNETIKDIIRTKMLNKKWQKNEETDPFDIDNQKFRTNLIVEIIQQSVEEYNQLTNRLLGGVSPNQIKEAIFQFQNQQNKKTDELSINDDAPITVERVERETQLLEKEIVDIVEREVQLIEKEINEKYNGDWKQFFENEINEKYEGDWKHFFFRVAYTMNKDIRKEIRDIHAINENLYKYNADMQKQLQVFYQRMDQLEKEKQEKELIKFKKQQAKTLPLRETINSDEFYEILKMVEGKPFVKERKTLALILLYLTGLKVSNLLILNVENGKELFEKGQTKVRLRIGFRIGDEEIFNLRVSPKGRKLLSDYKDTFLTLCKDKFDHDPLFTSLSDNSIPMRTDNFEKELNKTLQKASIILKKHIRTHSFRTTVINELLSNNVSIDEVQKMVGHKSIESTFNYKKPS